MKFFFYPEFITKYFFKIHLSFVQYTVLHLRKNIAFWSVGVLETHSVCQICDFIFFLRDFLMSYDLSIPQCMAKIKNTQKRSAPQDEKGANNGAIVSPFCK